MTAVNVRALGALTGLRDGLQVFGQEAVSSLRALKVESRQVLASMEEHDRRRSVEAARCRQEREAAGAAYRACMSIVGADGPPDCSGPSARLARSELDLRRAEQALAEVRRRLQRLRERIFDYETEADRLNSALSADLPQAMRALDQSVRHIEGYLAPGTVSTVSYPEVGTPAGAPLFVGKAIAATFAAAALSGLPPGFVDVPVAQVEFIDSDVELESDDAGTTYDSAAADLELLRGEVLPGLKGGSTRDSLSAEGQSVYDVFFGDQAITLRERGGVFEVLSGHEYIFTARRLGFLSLPARLTDRRAD